jgi:crotonobetainyl-CoA:carnitine CoA-transferase CaiB-like acyl-CoA transferase
MLDPYVVLDFTDSRGELGPMLLADLGADVIRVETRHGSPARQAFPTIEGDVGAESDLQSLQFRAFNRNKRSIVLDPAVADDLATLASLIERAHFIFESSPGGGLAGYGMDFEACRALNATIVFVEISAFGVDGPRADFVGSDLVIAALGGPVALQGVTERAPVRLSVPQVWRHAGAEAAAAAMVAHTLRLRTGEAQHVDLSAQCVMTWTLLNAMDAKAIQGFEFKRSGDSLNTGGMTVQLVYATKDGHLVAIPQSKVILGCLDWMVADGLVDESLRDIDWESYDLDIEPPIKPEVPFTRDEGTALLSQFLGKHTSSELFEFGLENGVSLAPVNTLSSLLALNQLSERDYWRPTSIGPEEINMPGLWAKPNRGSMRIRRLAPKLGEHSEQIRSLAKQPVAPLECGSEEGVLPFAGIKVADFSWVGVGPISGKYLADHGADVVRIESETRPDVLRAGGPFTDGAPGWNRSQFFGDFNTSKQSITLDMKNADALAIAKRLVLESDVLIESFAPGAIDRMGLSYEALSAEHPDLIMISTCLMGQTGPASGLAGFGYHAGAIAGFYEVTGWPDLGPNGPWIAYTDTIAPRFISTLLAAALDHRRRTGEGCYIDVAQIETALHFLAPELLDLQVNGHQATRMGNRSRYYAPQGCYPCIGEDQWLAIGVETEYQWQALCLAINRPDWADDVSLASDAGRLAQHDVLDQGIAAWTNGQEPTEAMVMLQAQGVPAGVVQLSGELLSDPQYAHRDFYRTFEHPEMGVIPYAGHAYKISGYNNGPRGPAPCLGQHSFEILSEFLNLTDEEVAQAYAAGVIN